MNSPIRARKQRLAMRLKAPTAGFIRKHSAKTLIRFFRQGFSAELNLLHRIRHAMFKRHNAIRGKFAGRTQPHRQAKRFGFLAQRVAGAKV